MTAILPMSVISLVLGFLVSVMGGFSGIAGAGSPDESTAAPEVGSSAEEMSVLFLGGYTAIIDGLMAHQEAPDYEKAEATRQEMVEFAQSLVPQFKGLADEMQEKLDHIVSQD